MTEAERWLLQILHSRRMSGNKFRRQVPSAVTLLIRLIAEIDGGQHDRSSQGGAHRTRFLENEGYRILRFWNSEILANRDGVRAIIGHALGCITRTQPSPIKGRAPLSSTP